MDHHTTAVRHHSPLFGERFLARLGEDFLRDDLGRRFKHFAGQTGAFASLMSWSSLSAILSRGRLSPARLKVWFDGKEVSPKLIFESDRHTALYGESTLRATEVSKYLRLGATLILDAIEELHEPIRSLSMDLEALFHEHVQVNAYACWGNTRGFGVHRDKHDVLVMQVIGKKSWSVYDAGIVDPERPPSSSQWEGVPENAPPADPTWKGMLGSGDMIYIPKGFWHGAVGVGEPSLHLTFGFHNRSGLNLLDWIAQQARRSALVHRDLPRFGGTAEQLQYMRHFREEILRLCSDDAIVRCCREWDEAARPRADMNLPWSVISDIPDGDRTVVRWTPTRPVNVRRLEDDRVVLSINGEVLELDAAARVVVSALAERKEMTMGEIRKATAGACAERDVRSSLVDLVLAGLISLIDV